MEITRITVDELKERLDRREELIILDARNPEAWAKSRDRLPGAIRVAEGETESTAQRLEANHSIIVYCT